MFPAGSNLSIPPPEEQFPFGLTFTASHFKAGGRPSLTPKGVLLVESGEVVNGLKNGVLTGTYR